MFKIYAVTCAFIQLDILTGIVKGAATGTLSSKVMRTGLFHKLSLILIAAMGVLIDYAQTVVDLGFEIPVFAAICGYIIFMEIISIIENVSAANPDIMPDKIIGLFGTEAASKIHNVKEESEDEKTLLKAASAKYGFTYRSTSKNAELIAHLKAGGTAVCWTGGEASPSYPLFSNSGHFIAAVDVDSSGMIVIADSLYYSTKWTSTALRRAQIHPTGQTGIVTCSITALGKATANRAPSYFLISKKTVPKATKPEEETEMIEKTKFNIDGAPVQMNAITKDGTTFVCLREYNNALGLNTDYDAENSTRTVSPSNVKLNLDGNVTEVAGMMMGERNFVAVRDAFEVAGYTVGWSAAEKTVLLNRA